MRPTGPPAPVTGHAGGLLTVVVAVQLLLSLRFFFKYVDPLPGAAYAAYVLAGLLVWGVVLRSPRLLGWRCRGRVLGLALVALDGARRARALLPPALWDGYLVVVPVMAVLLGYRVLRLLTDRGTAVLLSLTQFVCWLFLEMAATGSDMVVIGWLFALATTASTLGLRRHDAALTSVGDAAYRLFATSRLPLLVVTAASGVVLLVVSGARAWRVVAYWSQEMRREVERVRATGTNLVFLGANTMYWRVRLEQGGRVVVGYRTDAALDPAPRSMRTGLWREAVEADPENGLTGMEYECFPVDAPFRVSSPDWWGFAGTGVRRGEELDHLVGVEADRVYPVRGTASTVDGARARVVLVPRRAHLRPR